MRRYYRRRGHRRGGMKLPIISLAILGGQIAYANATESTLQGKLAKFALMYTGFNMLSGKFDPQYLAIGYAPWLVKRFVLPIARPKIGGMHLPVSLS